MDKIHSTPWGAPQDQEVIADGIILVTTASHGGIWLSPARVQQMPLAYRKTFAGGPWFEEDCDWAMVAVTFPNYFSTDSVKDATAMLKRLA